ncbi:PH and SEC7 domain-containing protein-like [Parasteatoda tepidariorum]
MDEVREVKLKRSDSIGYGFSVFGGKGSGLPPTVYHITDESPAAASGILEAGDVILAVNNQEVVSLTTKEVLKCLRLSTDVVTLKVKKDATIKERVRNHMAASNELETQRRSYIKGNSHISSNGHIEAQHNSNIKYESNGDVKENGENIPPSPTHLNHTNSKSPPQPKFETFMMTGDLIIKTKSSNPIFHVPKFQKKNELLSNSQTSSPVTQFGNSDGLNFNRSQAAQQDNSEPQTPVTEKKGSISYGGNFVRTSRSEDFLQKTSIPTVNSDVEEDITTSLNNLLDTEHPPPDRVVQTRNAPPTPTGLNSLSSPPETCDNVEIVSKRGSYDERTGLFIQIPESGNKQLNGIISEETLVNDNFKNMIKNRQRYAPRTIQPKQDGVTNILIDENKIYVKVRTDQSYASEKVFNNKEQRDSNGDSPKNLRNLENKEESRHDENGQDDSKRCCSPEDESDVESLSSFHYSPKAVDMPSASRLAKRLYNLEGFKKSDVSRHLCKNNDFSRVVAEEYLKFFEFQGETLDIALRKFLKQFCLIGETQERERVLIHFSKRFLDCNPGAFKSQDAVHTLTCALMLLNTDLHGEQKRNSLVSDFFVTLSNLACIYKKRKNVGRRMTCAEFVENLSELNEGENFNKEVLKALYHSIKSAPLEWAVDDEEEATTNEDHPTAPDPKNFIGHNPFLEVPNPNYATEYKKGYVMRKCCIDPNGKKTPMGKRGWKMFYADLRDLVLYLHKDENGFRKNQLYDSLHNSIRIHHALATRATDYTKKQHVFRLETADEAVYLFQTRSSIEMLLKEQFLELESKVMKLEKEIEEHLSHPPERNAKSRNVKEYVEKENFLQYELKRYRTYKFLLRSKITQFPELEPPLVQTCIGEVDENLEKNDQAHSSTRTTANSNNVKRSLSDRFSYRAAIYKTGPSDDCA